MGDPPLAERLAGHVLARLDRRVLTVGELSLYVAYLDGWPARQRIWPWATALADLAGSVAGNIGHLSPRPGHPVILVDRVTAATSPIATFAGLAIGLLVLKMTCPQVTTPASGTPARPVLVITATSADAIADAVSRSGSGDMASVRLRPASHFAS